MRWFLLLLALVSFGANAIPDEILASYLDRYELCIKDARIRAETQGEYNSLRSICKINYMENVEGATDSSKNIQDTSKATLDWINYVRGLNSLPKFTISSKRIYFSIHKRATLDEFYMVRNHAGKLVLYRNGLLVNHSSIPIKDALVNAKYENHKIVISGMDSNVYYYVIRSEGSYRFHTAYGAELSAHAALFLAETAVIMYDDVPIGIISREIAKEITE